MFQQHQPTPSGSSSPLSSLLGDDEDNLSSDAPTASMRSLDEAAKKYERQVKFLTDGIKGNMDKLEQINKVSNHAQWI